jgi:hypothetical protein
MKKSDFELIGYIGIGLGILFLIGALLEYESHSPLYWEIFPEQLNSTVYPLGVACTIFLVVGLGFLWRAEQEGKQVRIPTTPMPAPQPFTGMKYCRFCGSENKTDASYCEECGKALG